MRKTIANLFTAALLCGGMVLMVGCGAEPNPLGVEAPAYQEFVQPQGEAVNLYREANENSAKLMLAAEPYEGDAGGMRLLWENSRGPRDWEKSIYTLSTYDAFPIVGEEGDFYKIYVSQEWLGGVEGYIKKSDCKTAKPVALTQELLNEIGQKSYRRDTIVAKGELKSLCLSSYLGEYDGIEVGMGQLCNGCLVYAAHKPVWTNPSGDEVPTALEKNEEGEGYTFTFGPKAMCTVGEGMQLFDVGQLTEEQIKNIYDSLHEATSRGKVTGAAYYIPDFFKERLVSVYFYDRKIDDVGDVVGIASEQEILDGANRPFRPDEVVGYWRYMEAYNLILVIFRRGGSYYDVEYDAISHTFSSVHKLDKGRTHGIEVFRCTSEREYFEVKGRDQRLNRRDIGDPEFVIDFMPPVEFENQK